MMSKKIKTWLDCDPGHDDAYAIILAAFSDSIDLIGISNVSGNQTVDKLTINTLKVVNLCGLIGKPTEDIFKMEENEKLSLNDSLSFAGMKFPILKGSQKPLIRPVRISERVHGESGLDSLEPIEWPEIPKYAIEFTNRLATQTSPHFTTKMYDYFKSFAEKGEKITLVAIGPLTNIALLLINHPDVVNYVDKLVLMGGSIGLGNNGPAEFNILVDPEAASLVFDSGLEIYMIPLEITHTALVVQSVMDRIEAPASRFTRTISSTLKFYQNTIQKFFNKSAPPLHDPCAVAFLLDPSMFDYRLMRVDVETMSPLSSGSTICDVYGYHLYTHKRKNVHVCMKMNVEKFWNMMIDALIKANKNCPFN